VRGLIFSDFRDVKNSPVLQFLKDYPKLSELTNFNLLFPFLAFTSDITFFD
jgi:hypothetical protein